MASQFSNDRGYKELALFAGAGGGILGTKLLGWRVVCAVEIDPYCREVLLRRQEEGAIEAFPIWDDVRTFDGKPWRGRVDVVTGGFPCPAFSKAGKGGGFQQDPLFYEAIRVIRDCEPWAILWENVEGFEKWRDYLRDEVENLGYEWYDTRLNSLDFGIPQNRPRYFNICIQGGMLPSSQYLWRIQGAEGEYIQRIQSLSENAKGWWTPTVHSKEDWRVIYADSRRMRSVNGMANRMDRLKAIGNGQVPLCVKVAWEILSKDSRT